MKMNGNVVDVGQLRKKFDQISLQIESLEQFKINSISQQSGEIQSLKQQITQIND